MTSRPPRSAFPPVLLAVGLAIVLLADAPFLFTRGDVLRGALLPLLAALAAALGALVPGRDHGPRLPLVLLLLPLAIPVFGLLAGHDVRPAAVLREGAVWISLSALGLGLARAWRPGGLDATTAWRALLGAGAVAAIWTVVQALSLGSLGVGPFGRPGVAGPVLGALAAAALFVPLAGGRMARLAFVGVLTAGCLATGSRTGILAALLGGLVAGLGASTAHRRSWGLALGLVAFVAVGWILLASVEGSDLPGAKTLRVRLGLWRATGALVAERPLTGHGTGSFPTEILRVRDVEEARRSGGRRPKVAHNDVLHAAAEGGVFAGLALLAFLAGTLGVGLAALRRGPPDGVAPAAFAAFATLALASLGEDVLLAPAGALVAATGAATLLGGRGPRPAGRALPAVLLLLALAALAAAGTKARDLLADAHLKRYRETVAGGVDEAGADAAARTELREGVLAWREDHPEGWYRLGVIRAEQQRYDDARAAWRKALAADGGMTEAWLDTARAWETEGRREDARAALLAARERDPTRYDLHMRLGHLALGPEPVPRERPDATLDPVRAHAHYNDAERVAPGRFETWVARARVARRLGDLAQAGEDLRHADRMAPKASEVLLESFRLAEWESVTDAVATLLLELALTAGPALGPAIEREAEALVATGQAREAEARAAVEGTLTPPDLASARRAYRAASRRLAGLARAEILPSTRLLASADADEEARAWRSALARLRALIAWATREPPPPTLARDPHLRSRYLEALYRRTAQVAARTDGALSRLLFARAHGWQGVLLLAEDETDEARTLLARTLEDAPDDAEVLWLRARVRLGTGDAEGAAGDLKKALGLDPALASRTRAATDLASVLEVPGVASALAEAERRLIPATRRPEPAR